MTVSRVLRDYIISFGRGKAKNKKEKTCLTSLPIICSNRENWEEKGRLHEPGVGLNECQPEITRGEPTRRALAKFRRCGFAAIFFTAITKMMNFGHSSFSWISFGIHAVWTRRIEI